MKRENQVGAVKKGVIKTLKIGIKFDYFQIQ
jgi:hypothetical protein